MNFIKFFNSKNKNKWIVLHMIFAEDFSMGSR